MSNQNNILNIAIIRVKQFALQGILFYYYQTLQNINYTAAYLRGQLVRTVKLMNWPQNV